MRLDVTLKTSEHTDIVTALAWSPESQLLTCGDDKNFVLWSADGDVMSKSTPLEKEFATSVSWFRAVGRQTSDMFAVSCTDGTFRFISKSGREHNATKAHQGAVTAVKWSHDGATLASVGEDGKVKTWSINGNQRSVLAELPTPVYCLSWGPDNTQIVVGCGKALFILSSEASQVGKRQLHWAAHDGIVLTCDWNIANNLIVSGGEDCRYKVWDSYGRPLYSSLPLEHVVTSVSWCPNGECFAIGSFNQLRLCDKTGWAYCRERPECGSVMAITWTRDGTQLAGAGGSGTVLFAQVMERSVEWRDMEARVVAPRKIRVQDVPNETFEELDFPRDRVVELALGYNHLIVATVTQCFVYTVGNLNTPIIFDLRNPVTMILLCEHHFLILDPIQGAQLFTFDGRAISQPKFQGMRPEFLIKSNVALSPDTVALVDSTDAKIVHLFDAISGRALQNKIKHTAEIAQICFSQRTAGVQERRLAFVDKQKELYITPVVALAGGRDTMKLLTHVESVKWNDLSDTLIAIADRRLVSWLYPNVVFVDRDLLPACTHQKDASEFGELAQIVSFTGTRATIRRADGAQMVTATPQLVQYIYDYVSTGRWDACVRVCRFVKEESLWACVAAMAINARQLDTAKEALAAINEVAKVEYLQYIKSIPSDEGRNAELAVFRRCPDEAEKILLQAKPPLVYRAIKLNIRLHRWNQALDLAIKHRSHVDTVLAYRQKYLELVKKPEIDKRFMQYAAQVTIDIEAIQAKKQREREDERERIGIFRK